MLKVGVYEGKNFISRIEVRSIIVDRVLCAYDYKGIVNQMPLYLSVKTVEKDIEDYKLSFVGVE